VHNVLADKVAILPNAISFEQAAASFLKGLCLLSAAQNVRN
jgi:NADPH2:quinone reductase